MGLERGCCEDANVDASAKGNPLGSLSILTPRGVVCSNPGAEGELEIHAQLSDLQCAFLCCRTAKSRLWSSVSVNEGINNAFEEVFTP